MKKNVISISLFWFFYMGAMGVIFPFISLYINQHLGISGFQLGLALAVGPLFGIIASPLWGHFADRTGHRKNILSIVIIGGSIGYLIIPTATNFSHLIIFLGILAIFTSPAMPLASSLSFGILGKVNANNFGAVRGWGTLGYLISVVLMPLFLIFIEDSNRSEISYSLALIFPIAAVLCLAAAFGVLKIDDINNEISIKSEKGDFKLLLEDHSFKCLLIISFSTFALLSSPISLFPILITEKGGDVQMIGLLWIPMLVLEVPLIFYASKGLKRVGAKNFILIGILCDALRWLATIFAPNLFWIFVFQMFHGIVVVGLFIGMQLYVEKTIPVRLRASAQTVLGMVMGLGSVASYIWSGAVLESMPITVPYLISGTLAIVLCLFAFWLLPNQSTSEN